MSFTRKHIPAKTLCIIDIWSYKLRACAAQFKNKQIEVLAYHEKRQDISYFANNECLNVPGLCKNIANILDIVEQQWEVRCKDIVINYPFWELFLWSKSINYKRDHPHRKIDKQELLNIFSSIEKLCLKSLSERIDRYYGLSQNEVQILLSRVNNIHIDGKKIDKIIWVEGENMKVSLLNAFIPSLKHSLISQIGNVLWKNIYRILPSEYCISKIFNQKNILIINIWATQTTLTLKLEWELVAISKLSIWINDLVNKITKKTWQTKASVISKLGESDFCDTEKLEFLSIWWESLGITLSEILWDKVCPKYMYIWWGWASNEFIKKYIWEYDFRAHNIKILKSIKFVDEDLTQIFWVMKNLKLEDIKKIPLDIYVLLHETNTIISRENDVISTCLKKAIKKLWYINS